MTQALPATRLQRLTVPVTGGTTGQARVPLIVLLVHAAIGAASIPVPAIGSAHGIAVCLTTVGMSLASRRVDRILMVCFYAALCDVFWRMTKASVPWEITKYLVMFSMAAIVVRFVRHPKRVGIPATYLVALVPSCVITIAALGIGPHEKPSLPTWRGRSLSVSRFSAVVSSSPHTETCRHCSGPWLARSSSSPPASP